MKPFIRVSLSLEDLCGAEYVEALCENRAFLSGEPAETLRKISREPVECFPPDFEQRLVRLLPRVGEKVGGCLASSPSGTTSADYARNSKVRMAPVSALGYFRIGEDGKLYLTTKSEHYHTPLGHGFPGYGLLERARALGVPNATHNNTRGFITRRLEEELVRSVNRLEAGQALEGVLKSDSRTILNRVLNLETGSLAVEAALKMCLARFYRPEPGRPQPKFAGKTPVFLVIGDERGALPGNYHGTTILAQVLRGMWPEFYDRMSAQAFGAAAIRPNSLADLEAAFATYGREDTRLAGFFHEIVMMNYGGLLLEPPFLRRAYELCRAHDVPAIADEIQSCLWAPGLFLHRELGLRPSFVAVGKGFAGGEYPASRLLFSAAFDALPQFGALVTNGQEELASLAYLVTMRWAAENADVTRELGDYYQARLHELGVRFPGLIAGIDGCRHMACVRFTETPAAIAFVQQLVAGGLDVSAQTYKAEFPPSVLTKLPLIAGQEVVNFVLARMTDVLAGMEQAHV